VYEAWKQNGYQNAWCYENFIQARAVKRAQDIRKQLMMIMERFKLPVTSTGANMKRKDFSKIRKAITAGFFFHGCKKDPTEGYRTITDNQQVFIHPSSSLFGKGSQWVIYHELVQTTKEYMREVCAIDPKWLVEVAPRFFKHGKPGAITRRKRQEKLEPLHNRYEDPNAWRPSRRRG